MAVLDPSTSSKAFGNLQTLSLGRRPFLSLGIAGLGHAALASLLQSDLHAAEKTAIGALPGLPHHPPKAKRVIFLCQSGAPSQMDLFDYKPGLAEHHGEELPESVRMGQRLTTMTSEQSSKPIYRSPFEFAQHGKSGAWVSELLPHTAKWVDDLCFIRSMHTEAINHDPAMTFLQTGIEQPGRASMGSWVTYGLGTLNQNLPSFIVLTSGGQPGDQPLYGRLWGSGFLPPTYQGVRLALSEGGILYLKNPDGVSREMRRRMLDSLAKLNRQSAQGQADPEISARIAQYELAFAMQEEVPRLLNTKEETQKTLTRYGQDVHQPGTYAANCLLARRMAERGVRFIQLYHRDWDHHKDLHSKLKQRCQETDQPTAALLADLKERGLLEDTLVIWAGEFGRTCYSQGEPELSTFGRDHHPRCFTIWMAGGGVKRGLTWGETDEFSYNVVKNPVHVHDLQATILHLLGINHLKLTYRSQSRDFRLTDIAGEVVTDILA